MAIVKANFYKQDLNQFAPHRVRGELLDWGMSGLQMEVKIDASETDTLYAGDLVKILSTSTGKPKFVKGSATDKCVGYILYNPKKEAIKAGDIVTILLREGTLNCVTEEAIDAGDIVFYKDADGSVTKTQPSGAQRMGFAVAATSATEGGTFIPVLVC